MGAPVVGERWFDSAAENRPEEIGVLVAWLCSDAAANVNGRTFQVGGGEVEITANVPSSEILRYAIDLRSMTSGRGRFMARHSHYDPVPAHLVEKIVASTKETEKVH